MIRHLVRRSSTAVAVTAVAVALAPAGPAAAGDTGSAPSTDPSAGPAASTSAGPAPAAVRVRVANKKVRVVDTHRGRARNVLADEEIHVGKRDLVSVNRKNVRPKPANRRKVRAGDTIRVVRVAVKVRTSKTPIAPRTITTRTARLKPGVRKVTAPGKRGVRQVRTKRIRHNYEVVDVKRSTKVLRAPRPRRVLVGQAARHVPGTAHLNWKGLARCESGGNPRAVNPAGYYGLYQFNVGTWRSVGGKGVPSRTSAAEQTYRAKLLYKRRGAQPWPHCGRYL